MWNVQTNCVTQVSHGFLLVEAQPDVGFELEHHSSTLQLRLNRYNSANLQQSMSVLKPVWSSKDLLLFCWNPLFLSIKHVPVHKQAFISPLRHVTYREASYLWICPFLWRYSRPWRTSFSTVAILASSSTPVLCSPLEMMCLITSNTEPATKRAQRALRSIDLSIYHIYRLYSIYCIYRSIVSVYIIFIVSIYLKCLSYRSIVPIVSIVSIASIVLIYSIYHIYL